MSSDSKVGLTSREILYRLFRDSQYRSMFTPKIAIDDLRRYVTKKGFALCESAESVFVEAESTGSRLNVNLYPEVFLLALIEWFPKLRSLMLRHGLSPEDAASDLEEQLRTESYDGYAGACLYSRDDDYQGMSRQAIIDGAMAVALKKRQTQIQAADVLEALIDRHDDALPLIENGDWSDARLHVPFNTLSHINGTYRRSLWLSFDDIRRELNLFSPSAARRIPLRQAPHRLRSAVLSLLSDHPDYLANCFIIMPFHSTPFHAQIAACLRKVLRELGINPLRADDKTYSEDVMVIDLSTSAGGARAAVDARTRSRDDAERSSR